MNNGIPAAVPSVAPGGIGARLAAARRSAGLSQTELADRVGLSRDQLATIEQGRVPLRFWAGWEICRELNLSQAWLVTGRSGKTPFLDLDLELAQDLLDERWHFEEVCEGPLRERLNEAVRNIESLRAPYRDMPARPALMDEIANEWRQKRIQRLRRQARSMMREAERVEREMGSAGAGKGGEQDQPRAAEKYMLTQSSTSAKLAPVKSQLENLLANLNRLTAESGKKTELADFLGAPLASVSRWLSGEREPGGETTLRLLEWVQAEEAKPKSPARATTRAERKTQPSSSSYEKTKSNPQKR